MGASFAWIVHRSRHELSTVGENSISAENSPRQVPPHQTGQLALMSSHLSMQAVWNRCEHGNRLTDSPLR